MLWKVKFNYIYWADFDIERWTCKKIVERLQQHSYHNIGIFKKDLSTFFQNMISNTTTFFEADACTLHAKMQSSRIYDI